MAKFRIFIEVIGTGVDAVGVVITMVGALFATGRFLFRMRAAPAAPTGTIDEI